MPICDEKINCFPLLVMKSHYSCWRNTIKKLFFHHQQKMKTIFTDPDRDGQTHLIVEITQIFTGEKTGKFLLRHFSVEFGKTYIFSYWNLESSKCLLCEMHGRGKFKFNQSLWTYTTVNRNSCRTHHLESLACKWVFMTFARIS